MEQLGKNKKINSRDVVICDYDWLTIDSVVMLMLHTLHLLTIHLNCIEHRANKTYKCTRQLMTSLGCMYHFVKIEHCHFKSTVWLERSESTERVYSIIILYKSQISRARKVTQNDVAICNFDWLTMNSVVMSMLHASHLLIIPLNCI